MGVLDILKIRPVEYMDENMLAFVQTIDKAAKEHGYQACGIGTMDDKFVLTFEKIESNTNG